MLAGAGTGKTSTLTAAVAHRIAVDGVPPHRVLAVTFTNKAAAEMAGRIRAALGPDAAPYWLGTFHGLAARQLRASSEVASLRDNFDILDADDARRILRRVMKAMNLATDEDDGGKRDPVKIVAGHIGRFKDLLMTPRAAAAHVENRIGEANRLHAAIDAVGLTTAAKVYPEYQARLREANAADFGDLLLWPTLALVNDADYRARWAGKFDWVHADEYQDVNFAQYTWLKMLASHGRRMFVVGDDDQSIYGWRGADVGFIRRFKLDFPDAVDIRLEENFRSTGHILAAANAIIAEDKARFGKTLFTRKGQGASVELMSFRDGENEAAGLAEALMRAEGGGRSLGGDGRPLSQQFPVARVRGSPVARARSRIASSATSASTPAPRSRTRWRCFDWRPCPTIASRTRLSGASSTSRDAGSAPRRSRSSNATRASSAFRSSRPSRQRRFPRRPRKQAFNSSSRSARSPPTRR